MNQKLTKIVAVVILICFLSVFAISFLSPFVVGAAQNKSELQNKINKAEAEKKTVLAEKSELETKIDTIQAEIDGIQGDIDKLSSKISEKEVELQEATEKSKAQYESMKIRLRTMYEDNSSSYITLLFSGESLGDIVSYIELIKQVLNHDDNMYDEFLETQTKIEKDKKEIEDARSLEQEKKQSVESKKSVLVSEKSKLQSAADKLTNDIDAYKKAYAEAEAAEQRARAEAARAAANQSSSGATVSPSAAGFIWPAPGNTRITSEYGWRIHPTMGVNKFHSGIDIATPSGVPIVAAAAGTVVTATYNTGYGYYVVVSHGNGLSTLYAHHSSISVSVGQKVSQGQQLALSGSTGFSTGPHLHFEVLVNGSTVNPISYL